MRVTGSAHKLAVNPDAAVGSRLSNDAQPGTRVSTGLLGGQLLVRLRRPRWGDRRRNLAGSGGARACGRGSTALGAGRPGTGSARAAWAAWVHEHGVVLVVVMMTAMVPQRHSGEEDDGDDEHDPGDDGNPCRGNKDPGGPVWRCLDWGRRRCSCGGSPHSGGFRCFTHETHDEGVNNSHGYALLM